MVVHHNNCAAQVVVSPYGAGEWAPGDLEALLCGCLLVKPRPAALAAYPPPLRAGHALLGAGADWRGLGGVLLVRPGSEPSTSQAPGYQLPTPLRCLLQGLFTHALQQVTN